MTSNLGGEQLSRQSIGFDSGQKSKAKEEEEYAKVKQKIGDALKSTFRPEFLNRIDETVVFRPLNKPQIKLIAEKILKQTEDLLSVKKIGLWVSEKAKEILVNQGFDAEYGARPMRRLIQKEIENLISEKIIRGELKEGDRVLIEGEKGKLTVHKGPPVL